MEFARRLFERLTLTVATLRRQEGQTMTEYAVILVLIGAALVAAFTDLGGAIAGALERAAGIVSGGG
jgi:Flp pilus assembly pilin Flp